MLGFHINYDKSILDPSQIIIFLGMLFNTVQMSLRLIEKKRVKLIAKCHKILQSRSPTIKEVASLLGSICAAFEAVPFGRVNYRLLELDKIRSLKKSRGNFNGICSISPGGKENILWWIHNLPTAVRSLLPEPKVDYTIFTDASKEGYGGHDQVKDFNGLWPFSTRDIHINILEMKAINLALHYFLPQKQVKHVRIMTDNNTSVAYINKMGGTKSPECNDLASESWRLAQKFNCHLSACHIPGQHNLLADYKSRQFHDSAEWSLHPKIFDYIVKKFGLPNVDLFASHENFQIKPYVSWMPDPAASAIDAFSIDWEIMFPLIFPPFSILNKVIKKVQREVDKAILILPIWPTQSWFTSIMELAIAPPILFSSTLLVLPGTNKRHPLGKKLSMMAMLCSRNQALQGGYRSQLKKFSMPHGGLPLTPNINLWGPNGSSFVTKNRLIVLDQPSIRC